MKPRKLGGDAFKSNTYQIGDSWIDASIPIDDSLPEKVLLTHSHMDHIEGIASMTGYDVDIYMHSKEKEFMVTRMAELRRSAEMLDLDPDFLGFSYIGISDGDTVDINDASLEAIHTPGHTPGGLCYHDEDRDVLFSGDIVLGDGSPGRNDDIGGDRDKLRSSIERIKNLGVTEIYPGHGKPITTNIDRHLDLAYNLV